jgi:hypothetical protein
MRRLWLSISLLVLVTLAACAPATLQPTPTATLKPAQPTTSIEKTNPQDVSCSVVSKQPTPGPTEQSLFAPVSDKDWVEGKAEAEVTFIEYSDFQ